MSWLANIVKSVANLIIQWINIEHAKRSIESLQPRETPRVNNEIVKTISATREERTSKVCQPQCSKCIYKDSLIPGNIELSKNMGTLCGTPSSRHTLRYARVSRRYKSLIIS